MQGSSSNVRPVEFWSPAFRAVVFVLSATSIWCLLSEFYGLCSMRLFTLFISVPALAIVLLLAFLDLKGGNRRLWRNVLIGSIAGLAAAGAYDVFRLPFVFAKDIGIESVVPSLKLFKVFPRFGAMILGQPLEQTAYSLGAHLIGWTYHFSNGLTFGIMYVAMIGDAGRRHWAWAIVMAVALELGMLLTPYPNVFGIHVTASFVVVTLTAHLVFGVALGVLTRRLSIRQPMTKASALTIRLSD